MQYGTYRETIIYTLMVSNHNNLLKLLNKYLLISKSESAEYAESGHGLILMEG